MTRMSTGLALLAALITIAPAALAQQENGTWSDPGRPDDAAWVEDCPPDIVCAASEGNGTSPDNGTSDGPIAYGPDDCIHCSSGPTPGGPDDDTTWGTDCPAGVQCVGPGDAEDPNGPDRESEGGDPAADNEAILRGAPAAGLVGLAIAIAGTAVVASWRD